MVVTALVLPLLIMSVAFVVDVSMFFFKSIQVQRAADSAALAGVTRMPRVVDARKLAIDIAKRNGYQDGINGVTIVVEPPADTNKRLRVSITDKSTLLFFGNSLLKNWKISKTSTAEYVSNIPLGSKENSIGTGTLTDSGPAQGFWLAISGPCAPKEAGDQIASRYDGTGVRRGRYDSTDGPHNNAMVCDYNKSYRAADQATAPFPAESSVLNFQTITPTPEDETTYYTRLRTHLSQAQANKNAATSGHFPAVSLNRDWDKEGYNYIVDVPCVNAVDRASPPPPPCDGGGQTFNDDLSTSGRDLVIQVYDPTFSPVSVETFLGAGEGAKPDRYGIPGDFPAQAVACAPATPAGCDPNFGAGNPTPASVRVTTKFSVYGPDLTPLDYSDDDAVKISENTYGSCNTKFDAGTYVDPIDSYDLIGGPECATTGQWVTLARISPGDLLAKRGRFRINVRTLTSPDSFGFNSFALRSFFAPPASVAYQQCSAVDAMACASVSGDSSMSVFATAPAIKEFFLAKLSPASLYRGKTVLVRLWDAGEGGSSLQVLRPKAGGETCDYTATPAWTNPDPAASSSYCTQKIDWAVGPTGINKFDDPAKALRDNSSAYGDVCDNKGKTGVFELIIAGDRNTVEGCTTPVPDEIYVSRNGPYDTERGKFNDRMVNIKITVPADYGCVHPVTGDCVDVATSALPEAGWWKIKYIPQKDGSGNYKTMTDRSTWTVELLGEPVHLVLDN